MKHAFSAGIVAAVVVFASSALAQSAARVALLDAAAKNGCVMTEEQIKFTLFNVEEPEIGLDNMIEGMIAFKEIIIEEGDRFVFASSICEPTTLTLDSLDLSDEEATFVEAIQGTNCSMTEEQAESILPGLGFTRDSMMSVIGSLSAEGVVSIVGNEVHLNDALCENTNAAPSLSERAAEFVSVIEANGCAMTEEVAGNALPDAGFTDMSEVRDIVDELMAYNLAQVDGSTLTLKTENCN